MNKKDRDRKLKINSQSREERRIRKRNFLEMNLMNSFLDMGIASNLTGYNYLRDCIKLCINEPSYIFNVTKSLYPKVAKNYDTTPHRVERAIRNAIFRAHAKGKIINLNRVIGANVLSATDRPTNSQFIAILSDYFKLELKRVM